MHYLTDNEMQAAKDKVVVETESQFKMIGYQYRFVGDPIPSSWWWVQPNSNKENTEQRVQELLNFHTNGRPSYEVRPVYIKEPS